MVQIKTKGLYVLRRSFQVNEVTTGNMCALTEAGNLLARESKKTTRLAPAHQDLRRTLGYQVTELFKTSVFPGT